MDVFLITFGFLCGLCWGSFLNVLSYRITFDKNFWTPRSHCPHCHALIAWYHNIPVLSWVLLRAQCATCKAPISILYPLIELITGTIFAALATIFLPQNIHLFFIYTVFASALICTTRSDLEAMVIPQLFTLYCIPLGILCAWFEWSEISWIESIIAAIAGYSFLWGIGKLFKYLRNQDGLGIGDAELLAMIGSFIGVIKMWNALMIGSLMGSVVTLVYLWYTKKDKGTKIPFGPFIALGAVIAIFM